MININSNHKALLLFNLIGLGSLISGFEYLWIAYWFLIIFSIPMLIAKSFFRAPAFSTHTILGFIIYPFFYGLILAAANLINDTTLVFFIVSIILIAFFNYLAFSVLKTEKVINTENTKILASFILFTIAFLLIRQIDSILALDYLQHLTVSDQLFNNSTYCALPGDCSNLFLQQGYSTFYHIIQGFLVIVPQIDITKAFFILDLIWGLIFTATIYSVSRSISFNTNQSIFIAVVSSFTFINGAYEQTFFIPQTLAFWFFIITILDSGRIRLPQILASILILLSHFVIGSYLIVFLVISKTISISNNKKLLGHRTIIILGSLLVTLSILLAGYGFSFEDTFQRGAVDVIGSFTNPPFDDSVRIFLATFSHLIIIGVGALFILFKRKDIQDQIIVPITFISISITLFFSGITYSNKFLMGLGIFLLMVIVYASNLTVKSKQLKYIFALIILIISIISYYSNFTNYSSFYGQSDGTVSAISERDLTLVSGLNGVPDKCIVLSDPYTQIIVSGYQGENTVRAQYMLLETRQALANFVSNPTIEGLNDIQATDQTVFEDNEICFLLSSRLSNSVESSTDYWKNNIYSYPIDNSQPISNSQVIRSFFAEEGYEIAYRDSHFILFTPPSE